ENCFALSVFNVQGKPKLRKISIIWLITSSESIETSGLHLRYCPPPAHDRYRNHIPKVVTSILTGLYSFR
ncbi:hypothetical protein AKO1_004884, partial [Acrasis kona]